MEEVYNYSTGHRMVTSHAPVYKGVMGGCGCTSRCECEINITPTSTQLTQTKRKYFSVSYSGSTGKKIKDLKDEGLQISVNDVRI